MVIKDIFISTKLAEWKILEFIPTRQLEVLKTKPRRTTSFISFATGSVLVTKRLEFQWPQNKRKHNLGIYVKTRTLQRAHPQKKNRLQKRNLSARKER